MADFNVYDITITARVAVPTLSGGAAPLLTMTEKIGPEVRKALQSQFGGVLGTVTAPTVVFSDASPVPSEA